jgi:hypothetical protein
MKPSRLLLASLACLVVSSPAAALNVGIKPDCSALLDKLGNCNQQTPDGARIACQKAVCTSYSACLVGTEPITPIPQVSTLCSSFGAPVPTMKSVSIPAKGTPGR